MARSTISDEELLEKTGELFLVHGFAGTSLSQIASSTGLEKASLYYRFPGGKDEMAMAVAARAGAWLQAFVVKPLSGPGDPAAQLKQVARQIKKFYRDGTKWCLLDTLSLKGGGEALTEALRASMASWIEAFAGVARRSGVPSSVARERAERAVAQIEGGLVLARVLGSPRTFLRELETLPEMLLGGSPR